MLRKIPIRKYIITGLLIWVPLVITLWVLNLLVGTMDQSLQLLPPALLTENWLGFHLAGLGVILFGLKRLEPGAQAMPLRVRMVILPGLAALWPVIVVRLAGVTPPEDRA